MSKIWKEKLPSHDKTIFQKITLFFATGGGLGLMPTAPGTYGSLLGIPLAWLIHSYFSTTNVFYGASFSLTGIGVLFLLSLLAWRNIAAAEKIWKKHDDKRIVIDEVVGQAIVLFPFDPSLVTYAWGFVLFRTLDIAKPGIIGWADREVHGPLGTLLDDIFAALAALLILFAYDVAFQTLLLP